MKKLLIGNWKMNPATRSAAVKLAKKVDLSGTVVAPPFVFLESVGNTLRNAALGAQDVYWDNNHKAGAATGEVSVSMLKSFGVRYVIVGHSERRQLLRETDEIVNKKMREVLDAGLYAVLCVGEPIQIRRKGNAVAQKYVSAQLKKDIAGISRNKNRKKLIIAYEPIWAIGTGIPATPRDAEEMARYIKKVCRSVNSGILPKVLYGGSVDGKNVESFFSSRHIDGALVGGASRQPRDVVTMWKFATRNTL